MVCLLAVAACSGTSGNTTTSSSSKSTTPITSTPMSSNSSTATPGTPVAQTAACKGVVQINQALVNLSNVTVDTTVGDVRAAQLKVLNTANAIHSQIPAANGTLLAQITTASAQLTAKLAGYPNSTTIGHTSETVQDVKTKVSDAQAKTTQLANNMNCKL